MHSRLWLNALMTLALVACSGTIWSQEQISTGFYYPTGISDFGGYAWWLALGCNGSTNYLSDSYHLGQDMRADVGDAVYAIAEG